MKTIKSSKFIKIFSVLLLKELKKKQTKQGQNKVMSNIKVQEEIRTLIEQQKVARKEIDIVKKLIVSEKHRLNAIKLQIEMEKMRHSKASENSEEKNNELKE